jgi:uncharacterized membrane protein
VRGRCFLAAVAGFTVVAAAIRFPTLGLQSYRHDEAVTAGRVLVSNLPGTVHQVWSGESTPPLYYLLAWLWSHLFGVREVGLRSLSALLGTATVPVAAIAGRELAGRRAGIIAAALVAVNPLLVWYSQDARSYALMVLLCAGAFVFFLRARRRGRWADLGLWATLSGLALASHYFAIFPIAVEAGMLLASAAPRRRVLASFAGLGGFVLALAPIAIHQASGNNNAWIASFRLDRRLGEAGIEFLAGENALLKHAAIPAVLVLAAAALFALRGGPRERRAAMPALLVGGGTVILALAFALAGQDYLLARNLLPALVPLTLVIAVALGAPASGRPGLLLGGALVAYWLAFCVYADFRPALQREDWRTVAAAIGPPRAGPRAIVAYAQGGEPLSFYIGHGEREAKWRTWRVRRRPVREVDVVSGRPPEGAYRALPRPFRQVERRTLGQMTLLRYRAPRPVSLPWHSLVGNFTGYADNVVLLDGTRTPPSAPVR